jgi:hypothetical protein
MGLIAEALYKFSLYNFCLSFPRKRESIKISYMDSPITSGNDKKRNNERSP